MKDSKKEIIISNEPLGIKVAFLNEKILSSLEIEWKEKINTVGSILKGIVKNFDFGLKALFIDIGYTKNAFLHFRDIFILENKLNKKQKSDDINIEIQEEYKEIINRYPIGSQILVQIVKESIGNKGPRITTNISIPGKFLVLLPYNKKIGVTRKIKDKRERNRLELILKELFLIGKMGLIVRTSGYQKNIQHFIKDLSFLLKKWSNIQKNINKKNNIYLVYKESCILERIVRDYLNEEISKVIVDNYEDYKSIKTFIKQYNINTKTKVSLFKGKNTIFKEFNIENQIKKVFDRKISLPSGGEIIIEKTEALTAIDVNTGKHRIKSENIKNYVFQCNFEAASESVRQIKLRNIGGMVIIDFVDMKNKEDQNYIFQFIKKEMEKDRSKLNILPISPLGILQMTRQRKRENPLNNFYVSCPYCNSKGIIKSPLSISMEIQKFLLNFLANKDYKCSNIEVHLHPINLLRIRRKDEIYLIKIEKKYNVKLLFFSDSSLHLEKFRIIDVTNKKHF
jgi:ribonuclease G